jgi:hypothetical protein
MIDFMLVAMTVGLVLALLGAETIGRFFGRRALDEEGSDGAEHQRIAHLLTSIFGLLALLIGFSFSIAINRYETRRADVLAEANAISTAYYRAGFLGEATDDLRQVFKEYARHRVVYGRAIESSRELLEAKSNRLRQRIDLAGRQIRPVANTPLGASVIASINDVLDLGVQREANLRARLPWPVFALLVSLSLVGAGMMGRAYPVSGVSRLGSSLMLFTLIALSINVIIDLDRPAGGGVTVEQIPMQELVRYLSRDQAASNFKANLP